VGASRVISYEQVVDAAVRLFHSTGRLDMEELATAASVSRATLYRVAGSRDRVLGDVLWRQGSWLLRSIEADVAGRGLERLMIVSERFQRELRAYPALQTFLREDPGTAFRVLLMGEAGVHTRLVEHWRGMLEQIVERGEAVLPMPPAEAALVFVRLGEAMVYSDLLGDGEPDFDLAARVQRSVLQLAPPTIPGWP
jgi:AcrR family transcriptional regulator